MYIYIYIYMYIYIYYVVGYYILFGGALASLQAAP